MGNNLGIILLVSALCLGLIGCNGKSGNAQQTNDSQAERVSPEFSGDSALGYVAAQCEFGPRTMNSEAHDRCCEYLTAKFRQFGAEVTVQEGKAELFDGTPVDIKNIIAVFNKDSKKRIIISSHWDSRPWADNEDDESLHDTPIDGANDGASGVGILLEIARQIQMKTPAIGVELICWDAEDSGSHGESSTNSWCLGSQFWAMNHSVEGFRYEFGILLDMVGGKDTYFRRETYSNYYAPNLVNSVWGTAQSLGYGKYFLNEDGGAVTDDHVPLIKSGISCIDIIGSNKDGSTFPDTWHTLQDNINNIDKEVLTAVGQTVLEMVYKQE
ncbi:MAG: M28 family peptidase [Bacteroidaceae bacterium]|nr:M28 family peptidase [Bacteroidaceae bacterium]